MDHISCCSLFPAPPSKHGPILPTTVTLADPIVPIKRNSISTVKAVREIEPSLLASIFNSFDNIINNIDRPTRPSIDPKYVLSGNFAPVDELSPTECQVIQGSLPPTLNGVYIRNGPNPQYFPRGPYHMFDGDGMLHCIRICQGKATICSRYVRTYKYSKESQAGVPLIPNLFSGFSGPSATVARIFLLYARALAGQVNLACGFGTANTNLAFFGNSLYALHESDLPYSLSLTSKGDVETIGRCNFEGKLQTNMTAHPKIDPETSEAFAFQYNPIFPPFLTYFRFDANGNKQPDVPIFAMENPFFCHDFAITNNYAIFGGLQISINPMAMLTKGGSLLSIDAAKVPRIGIIPRYAMKGTEMKWLDVPGFNLIHAINAWNEEENKIVLIAANTTTPQHALEIQEHCHVLIEKLSIDVETGRVSRKPLSARNLDLAVINSAYVGKKNRFVYAAIGSPHPKESGVVKLDVLNECTVATRMYGPNCYGGEPYFVPRDAENQEAEEDDGYLVSYVHDEVTAESKFLVMDAMSPDLDIVAAVKLPRRVPYGFHGIFVKENDLKKLQQ